MAAIKGRDTKPEMAVRKYLFSRGLRYRVNNRRLPGSPDIVLRKYKTVVFVDGCFWHGHEGCKYFRLPKTNTDFWRHKIAMNMARDYANNVDLDLAGWRVIRVWECQIKTRAQRDYILPRLYDAIVESPAIKPKATPAASTNLPVYAQAPDELTQAAEQEPPYGN